MPLDKETIDALNVEVEKYKQVLAEAHRANVAVWEGKLNLAIASNNPDVVKELLANPVGIFDNCDCGKSIKAAMSQGIREKTVSTTIK